MDQHRHIRLGLASRLLLAALALFLPLVVFLLILVQDRNAQIHAAENQVAGLEYLTELRALLELMPHHAAMHHHAATDTTAPAPEIGSMIVAIERNLGRLRVRIESDGDLLGLSGQVDAFDAQWKSIDHTKHPHFATDSTDLPGSLKEALIDLFHLTGNMARRDPGGSLTSSQLTQLLAHDIPRLVMQAHTTRINAGNLARGDLEPTSGDLRRLTNEEWSLSLFRERLIEEFRGAVAGNPDIARQLEAPFESFVTSTAGFLDLISRGNITGTHQEISSRGLSSIEGTLALFDHIVPVLRDILVTRVTDLERTKRIAIAAVLAASLIAAFAGWLLARAMVQPMQAEIAERRRAEARLRNLAAIVEHSSDAIMTLSDTGIVLNWNPGCERLYGYTADEMVGCSISRLAPDGYENETATLMRLCLAGEKLLPYETVRKRRDGSIFDVSLRFSIVFDEATSTRNVAVIARDISLRKKAEAELIAKEQALQSRVRQLHNTQQQLRQHRDELEDLVRERTEEVREKAAQLETALRKEKELSALQRKFVSVASHEFRTPLAIIDGAAQRIERRGADIDPDDLAARISRIRGAVARMLGLIESTLSASRLDEGQLVVRIGDLDIAQLVTTVCERQDELHGAPPIALDLGTLPARIEGDANLLDQVFTNLVSNAVKYARDNPQITVSAHMTGADWIAIDVCDNGVGIPANELDHLFDRFFRASTAEGIPGTGIGLNLVSEFVALHGGRIEVESEVGTGSRFTVHLPVRQPAGRANEDHRESVVAAA